MINFNWFWAIFMGLITVAFAGLGIYALYLVILALKKYLRDS